MKADWILTKLYLGTELYSTNFRGNFGVIVQWPHSIAPIAGEADGIWRGLQNQSSGVFGGSIVAIALSLCRDRWDIMKFTQHSLERLHALQGLLLALWALFRCEHWVCWILTWTRSTCSWLILLESLCFGSEISWIGFSQQGTRSIVSCGSRSEVSRKLHHQFKIARVQ